VKQYFPPASKERADALIKNLLAAYKADIDTLDWMSPETKQKAQEKLAKFRPKIGYPAKFRDYGKLSIDKNDLIGNVLRATMFNYQRNLDKLSKPVDHEEWGMTPQTVNAYYDPEKNEIVFPAAILQPPFFNAKADDAVNYGGVGGVIGHEISHGFDDQGSQYDGTGLLMAPPGWFTQADLDKFKAKTKALVDQYSAYEPVPGYHINGELTLGENIADNAGLAIAFKAYKLSLQGQTSPVIEGMTGEQRFFAGWAQVWREKIRPDTQLILIKVDPHSAAYVRGTVPESNLGAFYDTFDVKEGDKMYRAPDQRITLW
jgi:putative endopeptidase